AQEKTDGISALALFRFARVHLRSPAASRCRSRNEPARARHRPSDPVAGQRRRSHTEYAFVERCGEDRDTRRQRGAIARDRNMKRLMLLVVAAALATSASVYAQKYPTKPIRFIVPFPPGDSLDVMSRLIAPALLERLGQNIIVDNRPGAAGQLGLEIGAHAPADGYTIVCGQGGNMSVQPHTYRKLPYDPLKDFTPVALSTTNYLVLVASPNAPFRNVQEMINYAKASKGKLTFGSNGEGGFPHMSMEMLRVAAGMFDYTHVPYKGAAQIMSDMMANRIDTT